MLLYAFLGYAPAFINRLHVHLLRYIGIAQGVEMVHCILERPCIPPVEVRLGVDVQVVAGEAKSLMDIELDDQGRSEVWHRRKDTVSIPKGEIVELAELLLVGIDELHQHQSGCLLVRKGTKEHSVAHGLR